RGAFSASLGARLVAGETAMASPSQQQHYRSKCQHHYAPPQVNVDVKRPPVKALVADESEAGQQESKNHEKKPKGQADIESHGYSYIKTMFNSKAMARATTARISGRWYQDRSRPCGPSVSE